MLCERTTRQTCGPDPGCLGKDPPLDSVVKKEKERKKTSERSRDSKLLRNSYLTNKLRTNDELGLVLISQVFRNEHFTKYPVHLGE